MSEPLTFPASGDYLVSVLLCTRGRPGWLVKSVESLMERAVNKDKIEFVFRADSDDHASIETCRRLMDKYPHSQLWISPRGRGYLDIHQWTYALARLARGDWLLVWNDDAMMTTDHWDHLLLHSGVECWHNVRDVYMLVTPTNGRPGCNEFYFLRRKVVDILGHISLSPHTDNWVTRVMAPLASVAFVPIYIDHYSGQMTDQTRHDSVAAYADGATARETLESEWAQRAIQEDIRTLRDYVNVHNTKHKQVQLLI